MISPLCQATWTMHHQPPVCSSRNSKFVLGTVRTDLKYLFRGDQHCPTLDKNLFAVSGLKKRASQILLKHCLLEVNTHNLQIKCQPGGGVVGADFFPMISVIIELKRSPEPVVCRVRYSTAQTTITGAVTQKQNHTKKKKRFFLILKD